LHAEKYSRGNQPTKEKPTTGRFVCSRFQKALYPSIFAGSFPKGCFVAILPLLSAREKSRTVQRTSRYRSPLSSAVDRRSASSRPKAYAATFCKCLQSRNIEPTERLIAPFIFTRNLRGVPLRMSRKKKGSLIHTADWRLRT